VGDIKIARTNFGFHIILIQDKSEAVKKYKLAILDRKVVPSSETYQNIFNKARDFSARNGNMEKFNTAVNENEMLEKKVASNLKIADKKIPGLENPRPLVKWAFNTEEETVSDVFELGDQFVVAIVTEVREEGVAPLDQKRQEIELFVKKDLKAEKLKAKINGAKQGKSSIAAITDALGKKPNEETGITFASFSVPSIGLEPRVIAVATSLEKGKISEPIKGNNGVFILEVTNEETVQETDKNRELMTLKSSIANRVTYQLYQSLREMADVKDKRAKFF